MGKSLAQSKTAWALGLLGLLASGSLTAPIAAIAQIFGLAASPETLNGLVTIAGVIVILRDQLKGGGARAGGDGHQA